MGPDGASKQLSRSPIAPVIPPNNGPKIAPVTNTEINLTGILTTVPILKVQKIDRSAVIAISSPRVHSVFNVSFGIKFFIKIPFLQNRYKKGKISNYEFCSNGMRN